LLSFEQKTSHVDVLTTIICTYMAVFTNTCRSGFLAYDRHDIWQ